MLRLFQKLFISGLILMLCACSATSIDEYAHNKPALIPKVFFDGDLVAHGVLKNRSGKVTRYFTATIKASWNNEVGILEEKFTFDDGEIQYRTWKLEPTPGGYRATASDVVGSGKAITKGNAMKLDYILNVNYNNSTISLAVEDWMWLVDQKTLLNESILRKWGFKVGSIQLVINKLP